MIRGTDTLLALARLAVRGMRSRGDAPAHSLAPRRRIAVECRGVVPTPERMAAYLRATDGTRIAAFRDEGAVASPVYPATWQTAATLELLTQVADSLPSFAGVVHLESETFPLRAFRPGDHVRCRVELERMESTPRGVRLLVTARDWNGADHLCSQGSATFLVRSRGDGSETGRAREAGERAETGDGSLPAGWEEVARWSLGSGAGRRYARASGDYNPIHLWGWTARPFGYRRPILHGFCTEAMVAHALIEHRFRGDPSALRRLRIAFRAPLLLPARVRLVVGEEDGRRAFRVVGEEAGKVYAGGEFTGA